jgi:hypothetical protein
MSHHHFDCPYYKKLLITVRLYAEASKITIEEALANIEHALLIQEEIEGQ